MGEYEPERRSFFNKLITGDSGLAFTKMMVNAWQKLLTWNCVIAHMDQRNWPAYYFIEWIADESGADGVIPNHIPLSCYALEDNWPLCEPQNG